MNRAAWARRTGVALLLLGASLSLAVTRQYPWAALAGTVFASIGLVRQLLRATREPALNLCAPALTRGRHPGRVGMAFVGVPASGRLGFTATCFVRTAAAAAQAAALGHEPAWDGSAGGDPATLGRAVRWMWTPRVYPGMDLHGLGLVAPTHTASTPEAGSALGDRVYGTDLVLLPVLGAEALDQLLAAWAARGIQATSVTAAMDEDA